MTVEKKKPGATLIIQRTAANGIYISFAGKKATHLATEANYITRVIYDDRNNTSTVLAKGRLLNESNRKTYKKIQT